MTAVDPKRSCRLSRVESIAAEGGPSNGSASWTASSPNRLPKVMPISVMPRCSISGNALTSRWNPGGLQQRHCVPRRLGQSVRPGRP